MRTIYRLSSRSFVGSLIFGVLAVLLGILTVIDAIIGHVTDQTTMLEYLIGGAALLFLGGAALYNGIKMKAKKK